MEERDIVLQRARDVARAQADARVSAKRTYWEDFRQRKQEHWEKIRAERQAAEQARWLAAPVNWGRLQAPVYRGRKTVEKAVAKHPGC